MRCRLCRNIQISSKHVYLSNIEGRIQDLHYSFLHLFMGKPMQSFQLTDENGTAESVWLAGRLLGEAFINYTKFINISGQGVN